eukprot:s205_g39.t1
MQGTETNMKQAASWDSRHVTEEDFTIQAPTLDTLSRHTHDFATPFRRLGATDFLTVKEFVMCLDRPFLVETALADKVTDRDDKSRKLHTLCKLATQRAKGEGVVLFFNGADCNSCPLLRMDKEQEEKLLKDKIKEKVDENEELKRKVDELNTRSLLGFERCSPAAHVALPCAIRAAAANSTVAALWHGRPWRSSRKWWERRSFFARIRGFAGREREGVRLAHAALTGTAVSGDRPSAIKTSWCLHRLARPCQEEHSSR